MMDRSKIIINEDTFQEIQYDDHIASLSKGLKILESFGTERQKLNVTQIAEKTGLSRNSARRHLRTLRFLGYLDTDEKFYWLTHKVLRFSSAYLSSAYLPKIAQPLLNILSFQTALSFSVVLLDEHDVVPIARSLPNNANQKNINPIGVHLGYRLPAYATSTGKLLLSRLTEKDLKMWLSRHSLKRITAFTHTDVHKFIGELSEIQMQDYCLSKDEHELGVIAIAVPILNRRGETIAALNCIGSSAKINAEAFS